MGLLNFSFILVIVTLVKGDVIVHTDSGPVQGKIVSEGKVETFLGIPYAEPPVGPLRLTKPVPITPWEKIYDATQLPPPCIQLDLSRDMHIPPVEIMSEDCLYLNIWVPRSKNSDALKPIMFFIHGGSFFDGAFSRKLYDGAKMAEYGDAVVVTINYRVGSLGFFTGFIEESPGSLGLYDQVMAMQWIKKNAKYFQGDPDLITLFGESAGAFSVSLHQISPLSKHLFKRAILQSGSAVTPFYSDNNRKLHEICNEYAELLGCTNAKRTLENNPIEIVQCLKGIPAEKFSEIDLIIFNKYHLLPPRIGNDFLPKNPIDTYRQGEFKDSEVLMGFNRNEGTMILPFFKPELFQIIWEQNIFEMFNDTSAFLIIKDILLDDDPDADGIIRGYLDQVNKETAYTYLTAICEAVGDSIISCGNMFQAEYQSLRGHQVYFYMFDHRCSSSLFPEWMGVPHGEELQFVFGTPMFNDFTEFEKELSRDIINMWVTFAKTGNPSIHGGMMWPKYTHEDPKYFVIGKQDRVEVRPDQYRCERWRKRYGSIIDDDLIKKLKER